MITFPIPKIDLSNRELARIARRQAWHRAKGELNAVLTTFVGEHEQFEELSKRIYHFINTVEDEGLTE